MTNSTSSQEQRQQKPGVPPHRPTDTLTAQRTLQQTRIASSERSGGGGSSSGIAAREIRICQRFDTRAITERTTGFGCSLEQARTDSEHPQFNRYGAGTTMTERCEVIAATTCRPNAAVMTSDTEWNFDPPVGIDPRACALAATAGRFVDATTRVGNLASTGGLVQQGMCRVMGGRIYGGNVELC